MKFQYQALDERGSKQKGVLEAADEAVALDMLSARGLTPIGITSEATSNPWWSRDVTILGSGVSKQGLAIFFYTLSLYLDAKLPFFRAFQSAKTQNTERKLSSALADIEQRLASGETVSSAFEAHQDVFSSQITTLLSIGERANTLPQTVTRVEDMLTREIAIRSQIQSTLIYPMILVIMSLLVLLLLTFFLVPTLVPVFISAGVEPPIMLRVLNSLRLGIGDNLVPLAVSGSLSGIAAILFRKTLASIAMRLLRTLPVVKPAYVSFETLRLASTLSPMVQSHTPIVAALKAVGDATAPKAYKQLIQTSQERIENGGTLSETLSNSPLIDPMFANMIKVADETDSLAHVLVGATTALEKSLRSKTDRALSLITPIMTLVIGLFVGSVVFSTITAVLDLNEIAF